MESGRPREGLGYLKIFGIALLISALFFLPYLIMDRGLFIYYGDFNVQQIPFYKLAHEAVRSGSLGWNWMTDLGANFIGSYSFYLLGNPFFWLTIPFPNELVPYLLAPLMILKLSCCAVTGYAFIRRFTKTQHFAMIGGLLYAFSGFNVYNIFFNHFLEVAVFFPLLLIALEEFVINRRRGVFAVMVCLCAVVNYYFFVAEALFTLLYFFFRLSSPEFRSRLDFKAFLLLFLEAILGFLGAAFLVLPSVLALLGNYRIEERLSGFNFLLYDRVQRYGLIIESFFFPPDMPAHPNFFPDSASKWASVSGYLPLFSLSAVLAFFRGGKEKWIKRLLLLCGLMALVPVLNSAFQLFNSQYYARWYFMPVLVMALASALALEDAGPSFGFGARATAGCILSFAVIGLLPKMEDGELVFFQLPAYPERFWAYVLFALTGVFAAWLIWKLFRKERTYGRKLLVAVAVMCVLYPAFLIGLEKGGTEEVHKIVDLGINGGQNVSLPEEETGFYRIDIYEGIDNYGMFWEIPSMRTFHSIVPSSIINFYRSVGQERGVASRAEISHPALRALFSVKYIFASEKADAPDLPNYALYDRQNEFDVYENEAFVPMGFVYKKYVTEQQFEDYPKTMRDRLLLKAVLLNDEQVERYGALLEPLREEEYPLSTDDELREDCAALRETAGSSFAYDAAGFTSRITLEKEALVFYSVPWESGWTATVNGEAAEVEQVSVGFMAVRAPAGENTIRFEYRTPGLLLGAEVSAGAAVILLLYLLILFIYRRKHPGNRLRRRGHRTLVPQAMSIRTADSYRRYVLSRAEETALPAESGGDAPPQEDLFGAATLPGEAAEENPAPPAEPADVSAPEEVFGERIVPSEDPPEEQ